MLPAQGLVVVFPVKHGRKYVSATTQCAESGVSGTPSVVLTLLRIGDNVASLGTTLLKGAEAKRGTWAAILAGAALFIQSLRRVAGDGLYNSCDEGQFRCIQNRGIFAAAPGLRAVTTNLQQFAIIPLVSEER